MNDPATNLPIVVLPGMDGTGKLFEPFVARLSRSRRVEVIAYPVNQPLDYAGLTDFVLRRVPHEPYLIAGESFGGPLAIEVAARDAHVAGLALVSTFARHPLPAWLEPPSRWIKVASLPRALIEGLLLGNEPAPAVRERLARILPTITPETMRARTTAVLRVDKRDRLKSLRCPILCITATKDLLLGARGLRDIHGLRPDCTVELIDGPHMLLETRPDAVADVIEGWCRRRMAAGA